MAADMILTLDFFLRDWNAARAQNAELWVCVQPHVIETGGDAPFANLQEWIQRSATGNAFTYRMASPSTQQLDLVPVNFCDDTNVTLELTMNGVVSRITNDRRGGARVIDAAAAAALARANREPDDARTQSETPIVDVQPGPFAAGYNDTLRDALAAQATVPETDRIDLARFAQILKVAFWGGTRRYVPASAIDVGDVRLMRLPESLSTLHVTNLHSLCGLMFRVGTRADLADLQQISDMRVVLDDAAGTLPVADHDARATASIGAFFSKLRPTIQLPHQPSAQWDATAASRVYAIQNFAALEHRPALAPHDWYRRQSESPASAEHRLLSRVRRVVVRFDEQPHQKPFVATPAWPRLQWQVWDAIELKVTPYRRIAKSRLSGGSIPLHAQPVASDRERFYSELQTDAQLFSRPGVKLVDANGVDHAASLRFIGAYDFPWDRAVGELEPAACPPSRDVTVIVHGPAATPETLTLLVPRRDASGVPIVLETVRTGDDDTFGPRWEFAPAAPLPDAVHFTHLVCIDVPAGGEPERLVPAIAFDRDDRFEFAQAASSIEGTLTARFPHGPGVPLQDPNAVDPVDEYAHDLVNHNSINVYAQWNGESLEVEKGAEPGRKPGHLNPYGQIYPLITNRVDSDVEYRIPFRHRLDPAAPPPNASSVRAHFQDMYSRIGAERTLAFDFEHTYGTQLELPIDGGGSTIRGLSSHYDFDLLTPPEVTLAGEPGADCPPPNGADFMTVTYAEMENGSEVLRFTLNTQWLHPEYAACGNGSLRATHTAAWRAVAEMAYASEIFVSGLFRRFDFHAALRTCGADGIAAGLTPAADFENRVWHIPAEQLAQPCRALLEGAAIPPAHSFEVMLTEANAQPKVFESCNVIEIFLTTRRDPARLAPQKAWELVTPKPQKIRPGSEQEARDFLAVAQDVASDTNEVFTQYLSSIAAKRAVVRPQFSEDQAEEAERFRRLLGNGMGTAGDAVSRRNADPGAWILPGGIATTTAGEIIPSVCPLTFRAPALDPLLGPMTFELVRKYFRLLQAIIDCDFAGALALSEGQWRDHFALLDATARALRQNDSLFDAALDSVLAVPDVDPTAKVDAEVRELALQLRDPASPAAVALRRWLEHQLWREPAMFGDAKALLFHRLRPHTGASAPSDFFSLESARHISEQNANEAGNATFRQSLVDLHDSPWFGIAEVLDDVRYDSDFTFTKYELRSFEGVVSKEDATEGRREVPILGRQLHLPAGAQNLDDATTAQPVHLASRAPVIPPVHLFNGAIPPLQGPSTLAELRNRRLSLAALKEGRLADATSNEPAVALAGATPDIAVPRRLDQYMLTALFAIHGDEEMATTWRGAFDNDELLISHEEEPTPQQPGTLASSPSMDVATVFAAIADTSHMHQAKIEPRLALGAETMQFITRVLRTSAPALPSAPAPALHIAAGSVSAGDCVAMTMQFPAGHSLSGRVQAILFAAAPAGVAPCDQSVPRTTFVLMINVLASVWKPSAIGIVHARNTRHAFAPDVAQVSAVVFPERFHQPFLELQGPALSLPRRPHTVREIVSAFGLADIDESQRHDISVTISHRQHRAFPASFAQHEQTVIAQESSFPLGNTRQLKNATALVDFEPDYRDFLLDVQWSSDTNQQFFRISDCAVKLTS